MGMRIYRVLRGIRQAPRRGKGSKGPVSSLLALPEQDCTRTGTNRQTDHAGNNGDAARALDTWRTPSDLSERLFTFAAPESARMQRYSMR